MNSKLATTVAALILIPCTAATRHALVDDSRPGPRGYTVLHHPAKPCNLSVEAVANWGETSAHLPQACTYS
jgi:hypothetical protein